MKVLVTGQLGYIGVEMVPALRAAGHEVVGLDTGLYNECDFIAPPDAVPNIDVDMRDVTPDHLKGIDAVMHLAALSNDPMGDLDSQVTYDINLHASIRLAEVASSSTSPMTCTPWPNVQSPATLSELAFFSDGAPSGKRLSKSPTSL